MSVVATRYWLDCSFDRLVPWRRQATRIALTCNRLIDGRRLDLRLTRAANHSVLPSPIRLRT